MTAAGTTTCNIQYACDSLSTLLADNDEKIHRRHHDAFDKRNEAPLDSVWYALMELESMLHERINDSTKIFIATISNIIESFVGQCSQLFECTRTACEYYFQSIGQTAAAADDDNDDGDDDDDNDSGSHGNGTITRDHHMSIIDIRMETVQLLANKWLAKVIDQYEQ